MSSPTPRNRVTSRNRQTKQRVIQRIKDLTESILYARYGLNNNRRKNYLNTLHKRLNKNWTVNSLPRPNSTHQVIVFIREYLYFNPPNR